MTFFNIFSKKNEGKPKLEIVVHIDNREKNSLVAAELVNVGCKILFEQLEIGDYIVGETAIERKTISDLKSSIINKRILDQLIKIKQHKKYALIVEGINNKMYDSGIHENALRGFLWSVAFDYKVPVIYTLHEKDTANYIAVLGRKKGSREISLRPTRQMSSEQERLQFILEGFPGIGPATAKKLLTDFKTIKNIVNASEEELERHIGKRARELVALIKREYNSQNAD